MFIRLGDYIWRLPLTLTDTFIMRGAFDYPLNITLAKL